MTPFVHKILDTLADEGQDDVTLARRMWPDSPAWRFPNMHGTMRTRIAVHLERIKQERWVEKIGKRWYITNAGRYALALEKGRVG